MPLQEVKLDPAKGNPKIEVFIGQAQVGDYIVQLRNKNGKDKKIVQEGTNIDQISDNFPIGGTAKSLKQNIVSWNVLLGSPTPGPGQLYFVQVAITQDGQAIQNGVFEYSGVFEVAKSVIGFARLV